MAEINETRELNSKITSANSIEEIRAALMAEAQKQGVVTIMDGGYVLAPEAAKHTRVEKIGNRDVTFTADTALELEQQIQIALKAEAANGTTTQPPAVDPNFNKVEWDLKFRRGEISMQEYLEKSGAVKDYLENKGLSVDALKQVAEDQIYEQSWVEATQKFLDSSDWPGGQANLAAIDLTLKRLGLTDATDKVAALHQAYAEMKRTNSLIELATDKTRDSEVATPEELIATWKAGLAAQGISEGDAFQKTFSRSKDPTSSSVFGGR